MTGQGRGNWEARPALRLLALALLVVGAIVIAGCGGSDSSDPDTASAESAQEKNEAQETEQVKAELADLKESGEVVDCGAQVFVNKQVFCGFAKNMRHAYYVEVVTGGGKAIGLHPPDGIDYRVYCSGTVPHRCTGFKDDGGGIKPLNGALIFFSP
jgi:hypothetical protein